VNLTSFRDAVVGSAHDDADALREDAERSARQRIEEAEDEAERLVEQARQDGREQAEHELQRERASARRDAGREVLRTRAALLEQLRRRTLEQLREQEDGDELRERLRELAVEQLGDDVHFEEQDDGGLIGYLDGRLVDYRLPVVVDREIEELTSAGLERLWE